MGLKLDMRLDLAEDLVEDMGWISVLENPRI